ncbi:MAG: hypothetical protein A2086_12635 [Spirochaetes bacterium GWD1_27_9]|nr:MAG: hypothetical protein A2Z98_10815 [Spirochaetes bacterium GWB1_27_13]OHD27442.1 MAG: hypothetical protein A2Y34_16270 [Spirochaetes bacterium GWC1_27_15]OHD44305.1 MAG: hypothetical protein A2086_12635 [Spirochaetes bacterium GWD1_27_9]
MNLFNYWYVILEKYNISDEKIKAIIFNLKLKYTEIHRYYHNLSHINSFFNIIFKYKSKITDFESMFYACCFHDIIYDPKANDNEEKSALFATDLLKNLNIPQKIIDNTISLILSTKTHKPQNDNFDTKIFLDADLSIFSSNLIKYIFYSKSIKKEYSFVENKKYKEGRKKVLQTFLEKNKIYYTEEFYKKEKTARRNINFEIGCL